MKKVTSASCHGDSASKSSFDCMRLGIHYLFLVLPNGGLERREVNPRMLVNTEREKEGVKARGWCCLTNRMSSIHVLTRFGSLLDGLLNCVILLKTLGMKGYSIAESTVCFQ